MSFIGGASVFIMSIFWPWFLQYIWPILQTHVEEIFTTIINKTIEKIKIIFNKKMNKRKLEAEQKAQEAENNAVNSSDLAEIGKYRAVAKVWREVAEQLRQDNDELKNRLEEAGFTATKNSTEMLKKMDIKLKTLNKKPVLVIDGNKTQLPALPLLSNQKDNSDLTA